MVEDTPAQLADLIWEYYQEHGRPPIRQWVRDLTKAEALGRERAAEFNHVRAGRAIWDALGQHGVAYGGYDPRSQESALGTVAAGASPVG